MPALTSGTPLRSRLTRWLEDELRPRQLLTSLNAALILFLLETIHTVSLTVLVFSGELAVHLPTAIGLTLAGNMIVVAAISLLSSYGGSTAVAQTTPSVILSGATAACVATLPAGVSPEARFATVLALIIGTTLTTGIVFAALGAFGLGGLVRFLPYPVMGGFLAGTGWLLCVGGIGVATGQPFGLGLLQPAALPRWLLALLLGLAMLLASRRWKNPLLIPGLFALALIAFHVVMWLAGEPLSALRDEDWLLAAFPRGQTWRLPLSTGFLADISLPALLAAVPIAAPAVLIAVISLLLSGSSLELIVKRDLC